MLHRCVVWRLTAGISVLLGLAAMADPVDNPGPFTATLNGGLTMGVGFVIGANQIPLQIDPNNPPTLAGTVASDGTLNIPQSGINFPVVTLPTPLGPVGVAVTATQDASGNLNAYNGSLSATLTFQVNLVSPSLPSTCTIGPITATVTSGTDGAVAGRPYDQTSGVAVIVNNSLSVPNSSGCDPLGGAVDGLIGLPAGPDSSGNDPNVVVVVAQFNPIFTGSAPIISNPGSGTLTLTGGTFTVGSTTLQVNPATPPTFSVTAASNGSLTFPGSGYSFPPATLPSPVGDVIVNIAATNDGSGNPIDGSGTLNPSSGAVTASINLTISLTNPLLAPTCQIGPIPINATSGTDGSLTGTAYSTSDGTTTVVSNSFAVPASSNCGPLGAAVDALIGLPSAAGANSANLSAQFSPIFLP